MRFKRRRLPVGCGRVLAEPIQRRAWLFFRFGYLAPRRDEEREVGPDPEALPLAPPLASISASLRTRSSSLDFSSRESTCTPATAHGMFGKHTAPRVRDASACGAHYGGHDGEVGLDHGPSSDGAGGAACVCACLRARFRARARMGVPNLLGAQRENETAERARLVRAIPANLMAAHKHSPWHAPWHANMQHAMGHASRHVARCSARTNHPLPTCAEGGSHRMLQHGRFAMACCITEGVACCMPTRT